MPYFDRLDYVSIKRHFIPLVWALLVSFSPDAVTSCIPPEAGTIGEALPPSIISLIDGFIEPVEEPESPVTNPQEGN